MVFPDVDVNEILYHPFAIAVDETVVLELAIVVCVVMSNVAQYPVIWFSRNPIFVTPSGLIKKLVVIGTPLVTDTVDAVVI